MSGMRNVQLSVVLSVLFPLAALAADAVVPAAGADAGAAVAPPAITTAKADLKDAKGKKVGTATLRSSGKGVIVDLDLKGVPPGEHAFHIHETGKCEAPFKTAGGHFNPSGHQHGITNPQGRHAGDLPNIHVPSNKQLQVSVFVDAVTLDSGKNSVFDADGSALVIHAGKDDYASDPAGNAGDRIVCGVIEKN